MTVQVNIAEERAKIEEDLKVLKEKVDVLKKKHAAVNESLEKQLVAISGQIVQRRGILQYLDLLESGEQLDTESKS